jgi:hypothetical protein
MRQILAPTEADLWHVLQMGRLHGVLVLTGSIVCGGCFQSSTIIRLNGDGSGTIEQSTTVTRAGINQLQQFAALNGGGTKLDLFSEDQARAMASAVGPGVKYVSSRPILVADGEGRSATYEFSDINQLRLTQRPPVPGGLAAQSPNLNIDQLQQIAFAFSRQADGTGLLRITLPEASLPQLPGMPTVDRTRKEPSPEQVAMVQQFLPGAKVLVAVEPDGPVVRSNSPYVYGRRVTLFELDVDRLSGTPEPGQIIPGVKMAPTREVSIEFTPLR